MKIFLSIFFAILLSVQLIPVIDNNGNMLSQSTAEEEVHGNHSIHKLQTVNNKGWYFIFDTIQDQFNVNDKQQFIIVDEVLIKCHHLEVLTQPPNAVVS